MMLLLRLCEQEIKIIEQQKEHHITEHNRFKELHQLEVHYAMKK